MPFPDIEECFWRQIDALLARLHQREDERAYRRALAAFDHANMK